MSTETWMILGPWIKTGAILGVTIILWVVGRFLIRRLARRIGSDKPLLLPKSLTARSPQWAQPVLRPWESERKKQRAQTVASLLASAYGVILAIIAGIYILLAFNINVVPLMASLGILGVAIGFGCQQLIRDFLAGIFIMIEDQYGIGDVIETAEVVGVVESVGLRITRVRAEDGTIWYLRNGEILRVGNRSQGNANSQDNTSSENPQNHGAVRPASQEASRQTSGSTSGTNESGDAEKGTEDGR